MRERWTTPRWARWRPRTAEGPGPTTARRSGRAGNRTDCDSTARGRAACGKPCLGPNPWGGKKVSPGGRVRGREPLAHLCVARGVAEARGENAGQPPGLRSRPLAPGPPPYAPRDSRTRAPHQAPAPRGTPENRGRGTRGIGTPRANGQGPSHAQGRACFCPAFLTHQSAAPPKLVDCNPLCLLLDPQNLPRQTRSSLTISS